MAKASKVESEIKVNLCNLAKIPSKDFEKHFRDWMERDDVARELQAQLRTDLIWNFNKTALGKQILSQTTTTMGGCGSASQRLSLSPLILALNTLVAEFLYAQNCHFTLSVFCTEVPFRNTLPDFERMRYFRFTETEITDILEALAGREKNAKYLKYHIVKNYSEVANNSLLLLLLKTLLDKTFVAEPVKKSVPVATQVDIATTSPVIGAGDAGESKSKQRDSKTEMYNTNFSYLNKYLILLSKRVKEMSQHFEEYQMKRHKNQNALPQPRLKKSTHTRKYESLNRSLERITENLKHMTNAKRKSKRVGAIVNAIDTLSTQFTKCATNFEKVSNELAKKTAAKNEARCETAGVEKHTETVPTNERTYADWVHEMRHSQNGQRFLDRIEIALRKALNKQRQQLHNETEVKLRHQKELLKIRYKQKLIEHFEKFGSHEDSAEARKINENIEKQMKQFEIKHLELLNKIREAETEATTLPLEIKIAEKSVEKVSESAPKTNLVEDSLKETQEQRNSTPILVYKPVSKRIKKPRIPVLKDAVNTHKQLHEMVKNIVEQELNVEHIVHDAKLRIQELENESNQLDQSFRDYLERQKLQKQAALEAKRKLLHSYEMEREILQEKFSKIKESTPRERNQKNFEETEHKKLAVLEKDKTENENRAIAETMEQVTFEFRNAILEAKERFFQKDTQYKEQVREPVRNIQFHRDDENLKALGYADVDADDSFDKNDDDDHEMNFETFSTTRVFKSKEVRVLENEIKFADNTTITTTTTTNMSTSGTSTSTTSGSGRSSPQKPPPNVNKCKRQLFPTDKLTFTKQKLHSKHSSKKSGNDKTAIAVAETQHLNVLYSKLNSNSSIHNENSSQQIKQNSQQKQTLAAMPITPAAAAAAITTRAIECDKSNTKNAFGKRPTKTVYEAPTTLAANTSSSTSIMLQQSMAKMQQLFEQKKQQQYQEQEVQHENFFAKDMAYIENMRRENNIVDNNENAAGNIVKAKYITAATNTDTDDDDIRVESDQIVWNKMNRAQIRNDIPLNENIVDTSRAIQASTTNSLKSNGKQSNANNADKGMPELHAHLTKTATTLDELLAKLHGRQINDDTENGIYEGQQLRKLKEMANENDIERGEVIEEVIQTDERNESARKFPTQVEIGEVPLDNNDNNDNIIQFVSIANDDDNAAAAGDSFYGKNESNHSTSTISSIDLHLSTGGSHIVRRINKTKVSTTAADKNNNNNNNNDEHDDDESGSAFWQ